MERMRTGAARLKTATPAVTPQKTLDRARMAVAIPPNVLVMLCPPILTSRTPRRTARRKSHSTRAGPGGQDVRRSDSKGFPCSTWRHGRRCCRRFCGGGSRGRESPPPGEAPRGHSRQNPPPPPHKPLHPPPPAPLGDPPH